MTDTWEEAAAEAANSLRLDNIGMVAKDWSVESTLDGIDSRLGRMRRGSQLDDCSGFRFTAEDAAGILIKLYPAIAWRDTILAVLARKQYDYGHDNIVWGGIDGLIVRMHDKTARIRNLMSRGVDGQNESLQDSWLDVLGYALMGIMLSNGTFTLPLAADLPLPTNPSFPRRIVSKYGHAVEITLDAFRDPRVHVGTASKFQIDDNQGFEGPFLDAAELTELIDTLIEAGIAAGFFDENLEF